MRLSFSIDTWALNDPFVTAQDCIHEIETLTAYLHTQALCARGEALGVDYFGETARSMSHQLMGVAREVDAGAGRDDLLGLLPPGGARNAIDCALWDLEAKLAGKRVWELTDPAFGRDFGPVDTVYTLSLNSARNMACEAAQHAEYPLLKLKLDADAPAEKLRAIRDARPDAELVIDANGGWSPDLLDDMADPLVEYRAAMLEQPLPRGADEALDGLQYPVPLCADESCQGMGELESATAIYDMVNIKLDKCGGLTEALNMVSWCRANDVPMMVGNMLGSSLAMAPAVLVAQHCRFVDLDGPLWQRKDRAFPIDYQGATLHPPDVRLWG